MKKLLKALVVLLAVLFIAAAVVSGVFYKKATPTLLIDLSKSGGDIQKSYSEVIYPEFTSQQELEADGGLLTSSFWTSKWCLDSNEKAVKSVHYDLTDYDFKTYLKTLKSFDFDGFRGVASMSESLNEIDIIVCGGSSKGDVILYGFGKTKLAGKTLEIRIEEAVNKGEKGETVLPVVLRDYTASAGDKLVISLSELDKLNTYHIEISEADNAAAPAYENENPPVRYAFEKGNKAEINIPEDGKYCLDFIMKNCSTESFFEIHLDGKEIGSAATFKTDDSASVSKILKLKKGKHALELVSEEPLPEFDGTVISPEESVNSVYLIKNKAETVGTTYSYFAVTGSEGDYCITSTELENSVNVNGVDCTLNEIGAVTVRLNKGFNVIKYNSEKPAELKITEETD